ncbi:hypothetical protein V6Z12_A04G026500 [Gossypium hirsutum]
MTSTTYHRANWPPYLRRNRQTIAQQRGRTKNQFVFAFFVFYPFFGYKAKNTVIVFFLDTQKNVIESNQNREKIEQGDFRFKKSLDALFSLVSFGRICDSDIRKKKIRKRKRGLPCKCAVGRLLLR